MAKKKCEWSGRPRKSVIGCMGIENEATAYAVSYRKATPYGRMLILENTLKLLKPSKMRKIVSYFYGDKVPVDHGDWHYLYKLLAFAVIEESNVLTEKDQLDALYRHRKALLERGPNTADNGRSVVSRKSAHKKVRKMHLVVKEEDMADMETVKDEQEEKEEKAKPAKKKAAAKPVAKKAAKEKKEKPAKVKMLSLGGKKFEPDAKFKWAPNAENSPKRRKKGKGGFLSELFKRPVTFDDAIEEAKEAFVSNTIKGWGVDRYVRGQVKGALRRLIRSKLIA